MSSSRKIELIKNSIERIIILLLCASILAITVFVLLFIYEPNQNALGALGSVCMDIVCILVLIILIVSITYEREVIDRTTRLFLMLMLGTMVAMLFDYLTWSLDGTLDFGKLNFVFIVSSLCMGSILAGIFVLYLCSYLYDMYHLERLQKIAQICLVFNIASFALALLLAVTGNAFELVDGHYVPGPFYDYVTVVPVLTLLFMTAYAIKNIKIIGLHDVIAVSGFIFTMIAGALIEAECDIGTTYVSITIADLYIFVMLQNKLINRVNRQKELLAKQVDSQSEILESMEGRINQEKKKVEKWIIKSNTDELTGFYNRHAYEDDVNSLEKSTLDDDLVYVSIDINSLKVVNDTLGHEAGDELIIAACHCVRSCFGEYGKLYRIGGDEFIALIYANDVELLKIKKNIAEMTLNWRGKLNDHLSLSCGYVSKKEVGKLSLRQMAVLADKRMYEEKTKYYQRKGIDRRGQKDAHVALCALYTKILKIDITNDSYQIVNINVEEKTKEMGFDKSLSKWMHNFAVLGYVHPDDLKKYSEKTDLEFLRQHFKNSKKPLRVFYRRRYNNTYEQVMLEIITANNYSDEEQNLYLYVKNIDKEATTIFS